MEIVLDQIISILMHNINNKKIKELDHIQWIRNIVFNPRLLIHVIEIMIFFCPAPIQIMNIRLINNYNINNNNTTNNKI